MQAKAARTFARPLEDPPALSTARDGPYVGRNVRRNCLSARLVRRRQVALSCICNGAALRECEISDSSTEGLKEVRREDRRLTRDGDWFADTLFGAAGHQ
jgi:hypothetical protein